MYIYIKFLRVKKLTFVYFLIAICIKSKMFDWEMSKIDLTYPGHRCWFFLATAWSVTYLIFSVPQQDGRVKIGDYLFRPTHKLSQLGLFKNF